MDLTIHAIPPMLEDTFPFCIRFSVNLLGEYIEFQKLSSGESGEEKIVSSCFIFIGFSLLKVLCLTPMILFQGLADT